MKKYLSLPILFLASIIWGFAFAAQKAAVIIPPFTLLFARSIIGSLFLIPIVCLFDRMRGDGRRLFSHRTKNGKRHSVLDIARSELIGGAICGAFLFIASALQQIGISGTDAGKTSFITALYVVIVPIYARILGKRSPLNTWIAVITAVVGFYLLCINDSFSLSLPDLLVLLCAFVFAMQIMAIDKFSPSTDGVRLSLVQFSTCTILSLIAALIFEMPANVSAIFSSIGAILFLGVGSSGIAYTCQIIGQKNTHPAVASVILSLESVFGALAGALLLGERMSQKEYVGCAVVFAAVIIAEIDFSSLFSKSRRSSHEDRSD